MKYYFFNSVISILYLKSINTTYLDKDDNKAVYDLMHV